MTLSLKKRPKLLVGDYTVWAIFFTLCFISVIEVYSAGSYLTIKENSYFSPLFNRSATSDWPLSRPRWCSSSTSVTCLI